MAIIIVGTRSRTTTDREKTAQTGTCPSCRQIVQLQPVRIRRYFTAFFIPLFPIEKGQRALRCPNCEARFVANAS
jgi:hypothetical protein